MSGRRVIVVAGMFEKMASGGFEMLALFFVIIMAFTLIWGYLSVSGVRGRRF